MEKATHQDVLARIVALSGAGEEALVVLGEVGSGKSSLLQSALSLSDIPAEIVPTRPGESSFPLTGLAAVLDAIRGEHSAHFARHFHLRSDEPEALFAAAIDVLDLIIGLRLPPMLVLIDRIDCMDVASQALVGVIAGHLSGTGLRIVGTADHVDPEGPFADLTCVQLAPWSSEELVDHARSQIADSDDSTLRILAGYAGGNPGILVEQLDALQPDQVAGSAWLTLPPRVTDSLAQLTGWPDAVPDAEHRSLLELISVAPLCHIDALRQVRPGHIDRVEDLVDANLLQLRGSHISFVDQRLRSHAYWGQPAHARQARHRELAEAVETHDPPMACWHRSFIAMDEAVAEELLNAASRFVGRHRIPEAVEFIERALRRTDSVEEHATTLVKLCSQLMRVGELSLVVRYSEFAGAPQTESETILELAALKMTAQMFDRQLMRDEEAKALVALHADKSVDRAADLLTLTALYRAERWELQEAREVIEPAHDLFETVVPHTKRKVSTVLEILDALEGNATSVDRHGDPHRDEVEDLPPELLLMRGRALTFREEYSEARRIFHLVLNHPTTRDRIWSDLAMYASISNEIAAGQFQLARMAIDSWGSSSPWINRRTAANVMIDAWQHYSVGDVTRAREVVDTVLHLASKESCLGLRARAYALRGSIELLSGDAESAVMDLRHVSVISRQLSNPSLPRHWADYVEACALTGRVKESNAAAATLERRIKTHPSRWGDLALARCQSIAEPSAKSLDLFGEAVQRFDRGEQPYELGRTLAAFADRQSLLGMEGEARHTRVAAITAFEECGANAWAHRVPQPLRESQPEKAPPLLEHLTSDEREVTQGLLQGMRNREIADTLHVSVRTVELRLTRIYRALDVRSRGELAALFRGNDTQADRVG